MPFAGVIGNLLKKRSDKNAQDQQQQNQQQQQFEEHPGSHGPGHLCLRDIPPFPSFPSKRNHPYTGIRRISEPKEGEETQQLTEQYEDQDQENDASFSDSMCSADWSQSLEQPNTRKDATPFNFDGVKDEEEDEQGTKEEENNANDQEKDADKISYGALYAGISIFFLGLVFSFTGHGERGFKTVWLLLVGPILCAIGFVLVVVKIVLCHRPQGSSLPCFGCSEVKSLKNSQVGQLAPTSLIEMEKGQETNHVNHHTGEFQNVTGNSPKLFSPRITFLRNDSIGAPINKKTVVSKLRNEIPNYIENLSEEEIARHDDRIYNSTSGRINEIPLNPKNLPHHNNYNYHHDF